MNTDAAVVCGLAIVGMVAYKWSTGRRGDWPVKTTEIAPTMTILLNKAQYEGNEVAKLYKKQEYSQSVLHLGRAEGIITTIESLSSSYNVNWQHMDDLRRLRNRLQEWRVSLVK